MTGLPWVRLDASIYSHDKILDLVQQRNGHRAFTAYIFALAWSVHTGTDGHVPAHVLRHLDITRATADQLVDAQLWRHVEGGAYEIYNFAERQQTSFTSEQRRTDAKIASARMNCARWHGPDCGCWKLTANGITR